MDGHFKQSSRVFSPWMKILFFVALCECAGLVLILFFGISFYHPLERWKEVLFSTRQNTPLAVVEARAKAGNPDAETELGRRYLRGKGGVERNYEEALSWLQKAADHGNARGQAFLGIMYDEGDGVPQNYKLALQWYQKSADQGMDLEWIRIMRKHWLGSKRRQHRMILWLKVTLDEYIRMA
jgi:TPR repeat protein